MTRGSSGASSLREDRAFAATPSSPQAVSPVPASIPLRVAARLLRERDQRSRYLPSCFTDGATWGVLLDLYRNEPQRISSVCYGSGEAFTTALRAVHDLEAAGHIKREAVRDDKRGAALRLSDWVRGQLTDYLDAIDDTHAQRGDAPEIAAPCLMSGGGAKQSPKPSLGETP